MRMKSQPEPSTQEVLAGLVERVTYHNEEKITVTSSRWPRALIRRTQSATAFL